MKLYHKCGKRIREIEEMEVWPEEYICPYCGKTVESWETYETES